MAFPPQFSSTLTYANRYDLDEIDVFLEGDSSNPMFFDISGLPQNLSFGKHYFYLSLLDSTNQDYQLRTNSKILFEFKSINNVVIKSDVTSLNQGNGIATCFAEVLEDPLRTYKEIKDGQATLTVVASLQNKSTTQNKIPKKFEGAMNYRCVFPIMIKKNVLSGDSPIITNINHELSTFKGQFSFVKASISPLANSGKGLTYDTASCQSTLPYDPPDDQLDETPS